MSRVYVLRRAASRTTPVTPIVVIGAGPAGLAAAGALHARGLDALVLECDDTIASSWRHHYDRLHLHTPRWLSGLPGFAIPESEGRWVSRDGVVRYLDAYAEFHRLTVRTGVKVTRIDREHGGWSVRTPGEDLRARTVIVATGYNHTPAIPDWPGKGEFTGELIHSSAYRNGEPFKDRDVMVVGSGNSGAEIAVDLTEHGARRVRISVRTPPHVLPRQAYGIPTQVFSVLMRRMPSALADALVEPMRRLTVPDLTAYGFPDPGKGVHTRARRGEIPILDVGFVDALRAGRITPVPAVTGFEGPWVTLADGSRIDPEVVVAATGYVRGLTELVGHLGVLDAKGLPRAHGRHTAPEAPGLYFLGFTNPISGMFREIGIDARRIARTLSHL
ncbi:flavin-containing monooxygenase [Streptomyces sp. NPDC001002]